MKLVILGAGGFIGSNLVEHLIARGEHETVGVDITSDKLEGITGPNFTFIRADIAQATEEVADLLAQSDVVVDVVAYAHTST